LENCKNCFSMIPSTRSPVAARISASIEDTEIEA
jgi:hypothetical protein